MVKLLLRNGANPALGSCLTLRPPYGPEELVPGHWTELRSSRSLPRKLAFHFAVCGDHVEVLQTLFDWERSTMLSSSISGGDPAAPLFIACEATAKKCLLFMLEQRFASTIVNATNEKGKVQYS